LYGQYCGNKSPSAIKRAVLGDELAAARKRVPSLKASSVPALAALGTELEAAVAVAEQAATEPGAIPRTPAACAFRQAPLGPALRAHNQEVVPRAPRPNARLTNAQIAGVRGILSNAEFRATAARRVHIDAVDVARKAAHGLPSQMPHRPERTRLPSSFAERFFKRVRTAPQGDGPATT
jgi:hypothetical protein